MPRWVHKVNRVVITIRIQVLCPGLVDIAPVCVPGYKPSHRRVVEPGPHLVEAWAGVVRHAGIGEPNIQHP